MQPRCSSRPMATACFWSQALGHTFFPATFCVMLQMVKVKNFNARDDESIRHLIHRSNLVVNCIGIQKETMNWSFQETHVDIAAKIAQACKENEMVERFWHVGCLGANENSTSRRLQSKVRCNPAQLYNEKKHLLRSPVLYRAAHRQHSSILGIPYGIVHIL